MACYTQKSLFIAFTCYRSCSNDVNYPLDHNFYIWIERICFRNFLSARLDEFLAGITLAFSTSSLCLHVSQVLARSNHNLRNRTLVNVSFVHCRALLWVQMFLPSPPPIPDICHNQDNRWLCKKFSQVKFFSIGTRKKCFSHSVKFSHTVLSRDNFCREFVHFQVTNFLASNCSCVKGWQIWEMPYTWPLDLEFVTVTRVSPSKLKIIIFCQFHHKNFT